MTVEGTRMQACRGGDVKRGEGFPAVTDWCHCTSSGRRSHIPSYLRDIRRGGVETAARCGCARDAYTANPACDTPDGITRLWYGREGCGVLVIGYL